ncbi:MAG: hypothetical protein ACYC6Y_28170 [Thermoguttaceae bacterium]
MKCPRCWADKAYLTGSHGWWEVVLGCLAFRTMKCTHCYHRFTVHWVLTIGKQVVPPMLKVTDYRSEGARRPDKNPPRRKTAA